MPDRRVTVELSEENFDWLARLSLRSGRSLKYVINRVIVCAASHTPVRITPPAKLHPGRRLMLVRGVEGE